MPRLSSLPSRLSSLPHRVGTAPGPAGKPAPKRVRNAAPWKGWYSTAAWQALRLKTFERDGYICQRSGLICSGAHPAPDSPVANHKIPHRGDEALFWDPDNIETVTKAVHDTIIQAEEQESLHRRGHWG